MSGLGLGPDGDVHEMLPEPRPALVPVLADLCPETLADDARRAAREAGGGTAEHVARQIMAAWRAAHLPTLNPRSET